MKEKLKQLYTRLGELKAQRAELLAEEQRLQRPPSDAAKLGRCRHRLVDITSEIQAVEAEAELVEIQFLRELLRVG